MKNWDAYATVATRAATVTLIPNGCSSGLGINNNNELF